MSDHEFDGDFVYTVSYVLKQFSTFYYDEKKMKKVSRNPFTNTENEDLSAIPVKDTRVFFIKKSRDFC